MRRAIFKYADGRNIHQNIEDGPPTYRVVEFGPSEPCFHAGWRPPDMITRDFHETKLYTRGGTYVLSLFSEMRAWGQRFEQPSSPAATPSKGDNK